MALADRLTDWLKDCNKLVILGIGNPMRGDDAVGIEIVKLLKRRVPENVKLLECQTVPENFIKEIRRFNPSHVLMIDAAGFEAKPGEAKLVSPEEISGMALSTHALPLSILAEILQKSMNVKVILLGVQPKKIEFGEKLTPELKKAVREIAKVLTKALEKTLRIYN